MYIYIISAVQFNQGSYNILLMADAKKVSITSIYVLLNLQHLEILCADKICQYSKKS